MRRYAAYDALVLPDVEEAVVASREERVVELAAAEEGYIDFLKSLSSFKGGKDTAFNAQYLF